jgi:hypothetical protein
MIRKATANSDRDAIRSLTEIINVGESVAGDLTRVGIVRAQRLIGNDPWKLYCKICATDGAMHDPCLLDVLMSAVDFMDGQPPRKWWSYGTQRKATYGERLEALAKKFSATKTKRRGKKPRRR